MRFFKGLRIFLHNPFGSGLHRVLLRTCILPVAERHRWLLLPLARLAVLRERIYFKVSMAAPSKSRHDAATHIRRRQSKGRSKNNPAGPFPRCAACTFPPDNAIRLG